MMERALKERIIGAVVLVVFVVLVVPIFLDGPPADQEVVTERVLLPGASELEAGEPVAEREEPPRDPAPSQPKPAQQPTPASSPTGMWAVQLGSFSNKDNAEKLAADLRKQGYAAFLSQLVTEKGTLHRVRIGPQKDREAAEATAARLLKVDIKGQVVPHP